MMSPLPAAQQLLIVFCRVHHVVTQDVQLKSKGLEQHRSIIIRGLVIIKPNTFSLGTEKLSFQSDEILGKMDCRSKAKRLLT